MEGREGSEGQSHKEVEREGASEMREGTQAPLTNEGGLCLAVKGSPLLMGPVCPLSQGWFEDPVHSWSSLR